MLRCRCQSFQLNVQSNRWATRRHVNIHQCLSALTAALICLSARLVFCVGLELWIGDPRSQITNHWSLIDDHPKNHHRSIIESSFHFSNVNFPQQCVVFYGLLIMWPSHECAIIRLRYETDRLHRSSTIEAHLTGSIWDRQTGSICICIFICICICFCFCWLPCDAIWQWSVCGPLVWDLYKSISVQLQLQLRIRSSSRNSSRSVSYECRPEQVTAPRSFRI